MARVLVVDDEPRIVSFVSRALFAEGFQVDGAHDGIRGLELARTGSYELVVLDLLLPHLDGMSVLQGLMESRPDQRAVDATGPGEAIRVGCRAEGEDLFIEVADEGRGIRAEYLSRIFHRFSRVEADRARSNGGTGLGLSITKAIVEAHGGSIVVESEEGGGATFRIRLGGFRAEASPDAPTEPAMTRAAADQPTEEEPSAGA
jgi:CheY-like chemotaxis protein